MADSIDRDEKQEYQKALSRLQNRKPCFETTNSKVFTNLHIAAAQKAAQVLSINPKDPNINQFIINTGMSEDGRYITDKINVDNKKVGNVKKLFNVGNNKYEIGIVLQFTDFKMPHNKDLSDSKDLLKQIMDYNNSKGTLKKYRNLIFDGLKEYCKWFWGDSYSISPEDVTEFIPDYDGGKIQIQGGEIMSMSDEEMANYLSHRMTDKGTVKARQSKGGEDIKIKENGIKKKYKTKPDDWIVNGNQVMDDSTFNSKYKEVNPVTDKSVEAEYKNKENDDKEAASYTKPRLGYKIGYEIVY